MTKILTPAAARSRHGDRARAAPARHGADRRRSRPSPSSTTPPRDADYYLGSPRHGIGNEFFRAAPKLKLVQLTSAGYDRVDIEAARKAKVPVANNGGANSVAVAEHAVMLMLAVLKKLVYHHNNVVAGTWRAADFAAIRTYEVEGKRLGIVGLGNIGKKVARRVQGFDMDVRYYDVLRLSEDQEDALGVRFTLFTELLRTCDIVTLHVPLNDVTRKMMSTAQFAMMKRDAILINTCRGPVVDEDALHQALTSGTIAAAGLDVMVEEPPKQNHPLFSLPERHPDAAQRRAHLGQLGEGVPQRLRQHSAHGGRAQAVLGGPGVFELAPRQMAAR